MEPNLVKHLRWLWNNIEAILFFIFFATFPFNIRKVFLTPYSHLNGEFNEYLTISFSWADLLILLIILIYTIKFIISQLKGATKNNILRENNSIDKSSCSAHWLNVSHLPHTIIRCFRQIVKSIYKKVIMARRETFLLILFLGWIAISSIWAPFKEIALFRVLSVVEIAILAFLTLNFTRQNRIGRHLVEYALILGGTIQVLMAVSQFALNRPLGARFLGESILAPNLPGVAKFAIEGVKHIRPYGTFPHPNILAGFLLVPILILAGLLAKRLQGAKPQPIVPRETMADRFSTLVLVIFLGFLLIGLFITFSRSALLALALGGLIFGWQKVKTMGWRRKGPWLLVPVLILFFGGHFVSRTKYNFIFSDQSLGERNIYLNVARETIASHPIVGLGMGQFVSKEFSSYPNLPGWQYQPVHNVYLLITSELGGVGLTLFLLLLLTIIYDCCIIGKTCVLLTSNTYCIIILCFLIISLFDHYFWDLKLGMLIFAIPFILHVASRQKTREISR